MVEFLALLRDAELQRAALLLVPLMAAAVLVLMTKPTPRQATAAMVAFLWQLPAVLMLHLIATWFGWWRFEASEHIHLGLPLDVWIGWAIWWGPVAVLLQRRVGLWPVVGAMVLVDLVSMPLLSPLVVLSPNWHLGEPVALAICLLPALHFARLTETDRDPVMRTRYHAIGWGQYILIVLPSLALAWEGRHGLEHIRLPDFPDLPFLGLMGFSLLMGLAAALEFARAGHGTPIPFDPPKRVVTTGPYAFCANPMQLTSLIIMLAWAAHLAAPGILFIGMMFGLFDSIYATWYNKTHISLAMPADWSSYREHVKEWRLRWRPYVAHPATLVIPDESRASQSLKRVFERLAPVGLTIVLKPGLETRHRTRLVYEMPGQELSATGVAALWRAFEHTNLLIVCVGWFIGLPLVLAALELIGARVPLRLILARREARQSGRAAP